MSPKPNLIQPLLPIKLYYHKVVEIQDCQNCIEARQGNMREKSIFSASSIVKKLFKLEEKQEILKKFFVKI